MQALGAHAAMLDTFSWQAEGFHLRQGYAVFGRLAGFPPGYQRIYLHRPLQPCPAPPEHLAARLFPARTAQLSESPY